MKKIKNKLQAIVKNIERIKEPECDENTPIHTLLAELARMNTAITTIEIEIENVLEYTNKQI